MNEIDKKQEKQEGLSPMVKKDRPCYGSPLNKPVWTLESGLTYSSIALFLQCREQFRLNYVEGWSPKSLSSAIEFGNIFHYFCQHYDFQLSRKKESMFDAVKVLARTFRSAYVKSGKSTDTEFENLLALAQILFRQYVLIQKNEHFSWLSREQVFSVQSRSNYLSPGNWVARDSEVLLKGKRDGVFQYPGQDGIWVFETKTKSRIDEEGLLSSLGLNLQSMMYAYATELEYNKPVKGILYNVIRRPGQRLKQNETHVAYLSRVEAEIAAEPSYYFYRQNIALHKDDLYLWCKRVLFPILEQIKEWWFAVKDSPFKPETHFHYLNPEALFNQYGRCHLFDLITSGNRFLYRRRSNPFPELED